MKTFLKLAGCWAAYVVGLIVFAILISILKLHMSSPAQEGSRGTQFVLSLVSGAVLVLGLFPMARGLMGSAGARVVAVAAFLALALGVNTMIEASVFTTLMDGGVGGAALFYGCIALAVGISMGLLVGGQGEAAGLRHAGAVGWMGRGLMAWLSWPVIYFLFGMCIAPVVTPYYHSISWLRLPSLGTIVSVQLVRSIIFAASSLPLMALWKGSRRGLWLALGLAHAATVGWFGLAGGTFLPASMRIAHALEITGDSFAYAGVLVVLFSGERAETSKQRSGVREQRSAVVGGQ